MQALSIPPVWIVRETRNHHPEWRQQSDRELICLCLLLLVTSAFPCLPHVLGPAFEPIFSGQNMALHQELPQFMRDGKAGAATTTSVTGEDSPLAAAQVGEQHAFEPIEVSVGCERYRALVQRRSPEQGGEMSPSCACTALASGRGRWISANSMRSSSKTSAARCRTGFHGLDDIFDNGPVAVAQIIKSTVQPLDLKLRGIRFIRFADQLIDTHPKIPRQLAHEFEGRVGAAPFLKLPDMRLGNPDGVGNFLKRLPALPARAEQAVSDLCECPSFGGSNSIICQTLRYPKSFDASYVQCRQRDPDGKQQ